MNNEIPKGAEYAKPGGNFARWAKDAPQTLEWFRAGKWVRGHMRWTESELLETGYKPVSSTSEEQPFTRDNLPADAQWVTTENCTLMVAKWEPNKDYVVFRKPGDKWEPNEERWSIHDITTDVRWRRIERAPSQQPQQQPKPAAGPFGYAVRLSDKQGIKDFVPPPLPEPLPEVKPRVSTINRAWRWLQG